jgi:Domain of unknown function (DUF4118)
MESFPSISVFNWLADARSLLRHNRNRFALAPVVVVAALTIALCTQFIFGSTAALTFAVAVVAATSLFGLVPGLCTVVLAVLALDFFYIPPIFALNLDASTLRMGVGLLAVAGGSHLVQQRISARARNRQREILPGIQGFFDGVEDGRAYGWAFDPNHPSKPVFLTVRVDEKPVACVAAVHYRPDLVRLRISSGNYAFYADLAWLFPVAREALIDIRLPSGAPLAGSPRTIKVLPRTRAQQPTILFMHIPKTAGTAFREAIVANYRHSEVAYLYPTSPGFLVGDLRALPVEQRRSYRIVIGHFQYGMHDALPQVSQYITVVREPVARVLSQYAFLRHTQPNLLTTGVSPMSLEEVFERRLAVDFDNAMVRCFSGVDQRVFPPGALTREIFDLAVRNLRTAFTFVGHQESSVASFEWLQSHFGWQAGAKLQQVNPGATATLSETGPGLLAAIRHYNHWDCLFYEEVLRVFPRT